MGGAETRRVCGICGGFGGWSGGNEVWVSAGMSRNAELVENAGLGELDCRESRNAGVGEPGMPGWSDCRESRNAGVGEPGMPGWSDCRVCENRRLWVYARLAVISPRAARASGATAA